MCGFVLNVAIKILILQFNVREDILIQIQNLLKTLVLNTFAKIVVRNLL